MSNKRSIFEDVATDKPAETAPKGGLIDAGKTGARRAIAAWLLVLFALVAAMIIVGGLTRLTDSGLSITEWKPVTGAIPPMSEAVWQEEFAKYKEIPEYQIQNKGMSLSEFKVIYWWEWGHRQLGRIVGLVWALGFFYFLLRRQIPKGWTGRLVLVGALGGLQGAIGWWMVSSGLSGRMLDVASYRLATHLGLAFVILALLAWFAWQLQRSEMELFQARRGQEKRLVTLATMLLVLAFVQILSGALVAGIDAGRGYIDWPMMNGEFLPSESFDYEPFWSNFFENPALVQFNHRLLGYITLLVTLYLWYSSRSSAIVATRRAFVWVLAAVLAQMVLGIITVLNAAPWQWAILHQLGAIIVIVSVLHARFSALYPKAQTLR
ncbi:heme A synthase [Amylibacter sp. IMCC11727]|uniref:heme A synthase n=1 Tax=Amylibacter sp. IMCC11727 TaxID=3039851 RepID=UPI00244E223F|nr:heme A synthase [Amylibacter sp. IMCC11727]WGI20498.1 COX15/CtaA family protein [Amylibacter sp. IMCC11727]